MIFRTVVKDITKYREYIQYSVKSELYNGMAGTYLGYIWWLLDPLMYMLVYVLVVGFIFDRGGPDFPIFVFCALLPWKWTSGTVNYSVQSIKSKSSILSQINFPKFILPLIKTLTNSVYYLLGLIMLFVLMPFFNIKLSFHVFEFVPIFIVNFILITGFSFILAHYGTLIRDLRNIMTFSIRFWFYLSPALYNVNDIPEPYRYLWYINPLTVMYESYRNVLMYGQSPSYIGLTAWLLIAILINMIGLKLLYENDKKYMKVI